MKLDDYDLGTIVITIVLYKALKEKQRKLRARGFLIKGIILLINNKIISLINSQFSSFDYSIFTAVNEFLHRTSVKPQYLGIVKSYTVVWCRK